MTILSILDELEATASTNAKVAILEREKNNEVLKHVFQATYNPMITYGIKQIPTYKSFNTNQPLQFGLSCLASLVSRVFTGNAAIDFLSDTLANLSKDDAIVIERIIDRDLRCGTSDTLASRVWPGLVPTFDVMLAHKDISGIKFPAYAQIKSDGARCHMSLQAGKAVAFSRNGKPIELHGTFDKRITSWIEEGMTLDGELLAMKDGKILDRKTGNGIVNKAVKGTISKEEAEMLVYATWDVVDFTSTIPYKERLAYLRKNSKGLYAKTNSKIFLLDAIIVNSKEEAEEFFDQCVAAGEEGAMIKNINSLWVPKRSKDLGKMKAEEVADLVIVGLQEGTGKNVGKLGAFICKTHDDKLEVNVGTGFSDEDRKTYWDRNIIGSVVEVMYNQLITDKKTGMHSLFLPRFLSVRVDKNKANTLGELK
jgi:hypothetical protein